MVVRSWRGHALSQNVDAYVAHAKLRVFPLLSELTGFRGGLLMQRPEGEEVEILVHTFWDSIDHIRAFAGTDIEAAVVEPEARAVLSRFETVARHYTVAEMVGLTS